MRLDRVCVCKKQGPGYVSVVFEACSLQAMHTECALPSGGARLYHILHRVNHSFSLDPVLLQPDMLTMWRLWKPPVGLPPFTRLPLSAWSAPRSSAYCAMLKSTSLAVPSSPTCHSLLPWHGTRSGIEAEAVLNNGRQLTEEHIGGLDVPVQDASVMQVPQAGSQLLGHCNELLIARLPALCVQPLSQLLLPQLKDHAVIYATHAGQHSIDTIVSRGDAPAAQEARQPDLHAQLLPQPAAGQHSSEDCQCLGEGLGRRTGAQCLDGPAWP